MITDDCEEPICGANGTNEQQQIKFTDKFNESVFKYTLHFGIT